VERRGQQNHECIPGKSIRHDPVMAKLRLEDERDNFQYETSDVTPGDRIRQMSHLTNPVTLITVVRKGTVIQTWTIVIPLATR